MPAAGQRPNFFTGAIGQSYLLKRFDRAAMAVTSADPLQRRVISEVLQQAQIVVETAALEYDTQLLQSCRRVPTYIAAQNADLATDVVVETGHKSKQS